MFKLNKYLMLSLLSATILNGCAVLAVGAVAVVAGATTVVVTDPRHSGTVIDDNTIATKIQSNISEDFPDSNIYVTCYNGVVLLSGQASTQKAKDGATFDAKTQPGVTQIYNYLDVRLPQSISSRTDDSFTTTQIKTKLLSLKDVNSNNVKIVTTNSVVYLMGIVTKTNANAIADAAAHVNGVTKVVTLFEYTS